MKSYLYRFTDGFETESSPSLTREQLDFFEDAHGACVFNGFRDALQSLTLLRANSHKAKTDGFQPGWHPGLGMEIRTNGQYQAELKARGMVEVGNEKPSERKSAPKGLGEEFVKEAIAQGANLSGNEAAALVKGESITG